MKEDIYYQARVAAVISQKSLGRWIEEAIAEKLHREADHLPTIRVEGPNTDPSQPVEEERGIHVEGVRTS
ncbi:MAG: hypothetical protein V3U26_05300 [Dehalococcoidia bacterium]